MVRPNPDREENIRWVEAIEIFHTLYIGQGPYRSVVPRLINEIVARLEPADPEALRHRLSVEFGRRGGKARAQRQTRPSSSLSQLDLFSNGGGRGADPKDPGHGEGGRSA